MPLPAIPATREDLLRRVNECLDRRSKHVVEDALVFGRYILEQAEPERIQTMATLLTAQKRATDATDMLMAAQGRAIDVTLQRDELARLIEQVAASTGDERDALIACALIHARAMQ